MFAIKNRWTGIGTSNDFPRAISNSTYNNQVSSRYLEEGSFFRIKTLTIGYAIPDNWLKSIHSLRFYFSAVNLLTFADYPGYDPEASNSLDPKFFGVEAGTAPPLRSFMLDLNLNF